MKATDFEFRRRMVIILAIFAVGIFVPGFPHRISAERIAGLVDAGGRAGPSREWHLLMQGVLAAGALVTALGALTRTWGTSYLKASVMSDSAVHSERLLADGPFRFVRNPLYFGSILVGLGVGLMLNPLGWLWLVPALTIFYLRLIGLEESKLKAVHGESFDAYCRAVPRLFPSFLPRVEKGSARPNWGDGFLGEFWLWSLFAAMLAFALTLNIRLFNWIALPGFMIGILLRKLRRIRR